MKVDGLYDDIQMTIAEDSRGLNMTRVVGTVVVNAAFFNEDHKAQTNLKVIGDNKIMGELMIKTFWHSRDSTSFLKMVKKFDQQQKKLAKQKEISQKTTQTKSWV